MFGIGGLEMLLIGVVALLVFGPKRLPELARSLGKGLAEFRRASSDLRRSMDLDVDPTRQPAPDPETQPPAQAGQPNEPAVIGADAEREPPTSGERADAAQEPEPEKDAAQRDGAPLGRGSSGGSGG